MASVAKDMRAAPERHWFRLKRSAPVLVLAAALLVLPLALLTTIPQLIGPMMWDLYIYLDVTNRIASGQIPSVDFFAPVGALGYYLFAGLNRLFPEGHPLLVSAWSLLAVTAPVMAVILTDVQRRSTALAFALVAPFLLYSLLPFNIGSFYPYPGAEGFGIYNRQVCQILYVLSAALVFVKDGRKLCGIVAVSMLALFFTKITGIVAGAILCTMALLAGRLSLRLAAIAAGIFAGVLVVLELSTGIVSAYLADILALLDLNDETLLPRLLRAGSMNIGVSLATAGLCLALLITNLSLVSQTLRRASSHPSVESISALFDLPFVWISAFLLAGLFFESQNTGSQPLIFLFPLLLAVAVDQFRRHGPTARSGVVAVLALAVVLPPALLVVQKASRAAVGMLGTVRLDHQNLRTLGAFKIRPEFAARARLMETMFVENRKAFDQLAAAGEPFSVLLFSDFDFQWAWLENADRAISAVLTLEARKGIRFETVMSIDFVNPFPWLMGRQAPRSIAVGADPTRAVPPPGAAEDEAIRTVDLALMPTCPATPTQTRLLELYAPALLPTHTRMTLTPCYEAFIRNGLVATGARAPD
ncbi:hypothetical protein C8J36_101916 [Rhizobium sp. PP-F2F-G48]|uniref:hypothetical protein n=1 Tax=Rhizobium sp. PP-F2F-G48 TaxID=2135651 RepID=UPI0010E18B40|nr:hypothetical protein [Rhizobium sp. PP-F2F-G48]TCM59004.1 hypothetical protein C8J36_101916 [Rhizobium sp. PP-F2F-G48]